MKKLSITLIIIIIGNFCNAQVDAISHFGGIPTWYTGWDAATIIDLNLKHVGPYNINFLTNNTQRMIIRGNNNMAPWTDNTGWVGIGNTMPMAMLHIGDGDCYNGQYCTWAPMQNKLVGGWRDWMKYGTFICDTSDNMYVGMKTQGYNRNDAVIEWGDDLGYDNSGPDNLRFIFTEYCKDNNNSPDPVAGSNDGLEVMRMMPLFTGGNFVSINCGVGNYFSAAVIPPMRRLEVLDGGLNLPQFRLAYRQNADINLAIFTDFQTTGNGNLNIRGFSNGAAILNGQPTSGATVNQGRTGFNLPIATEPQNTVEINSGIAGTGGLRFTQLNVPVISASNGNGLSVDANGDVIVVPVVSACYPFPAGQNNYLPKYNVNAPQICTSKIYEDNNTHNVGIDYNGTISAKFNVDFNSTVVTSTGIFSRIYANGANNLFTTAIYARALNGTTPSANYSGVRGYASGSVLPQNNNYGVYGEADGLLSSQGNPTNYGVYGYAHNAGVGANIGVYGKVNASWNGAGDWAGFFQGDVNITGVGVIPGGLWLPSDKTIKTNILPIENSVDILNKLTVYSFDFDQSIHPSLALPKEQQFGVISQELAQVLPQFTKRVLFPAEYDSLGTLVTDTFSILTVNYVDFIPLIIDVVKNQQKKMEDMQAQIDGCCSNQMKIADSNAPSQHITLSAPMKIQLGNCIPNPNNGETTIPFHVPDNIVKAEIVFTDLLGNEFNRVEITARGYSSLSVSTSALEDGAYNYSLFADGKSIDTKQMLKQH